MSTTIPKTKLPGGREVARLCFGTLTMGSLQQNLPPERGGELLVYAANLGVNFVDTADLYGTYPHIRHALGQVELAVATKSYAYDAKTAEETFRRAVQGIGREYIDVFLLHEQEGEHTLRGHEEALLWLLKKKEEGAIGAVGLSTHHVAGVRAAVRHGGLTVVHPLINLTGLGIADGTRKEMEEAIAAASRAGLSVYAMKPLGGGHLIGRRREALSYVLGLPGVDAVAVGMQDEGEIDYNAAFFARGDADEGLAVHRGRRLLIHDWCEGCGNCVARCAQKALSLAGGKAAVARDRCVLCGYCAPACPQFCVKVV